MDRIKTLLESGDLLDVKKLRMYLKLLKIKEENTYKHSIRVSIYSTMIAKELDFSHEEILVIWLSALLHDIGKLLIPNDILLGTKKLSEKEILLIKNHPIDGGNYLKKFTSERIYIGAMEHHERLDGKGYPYGKKDISITGRIIAIADTFDAMTSERTYQNSLTFEDALAKMEKLVENGMYDKDLFFKFKKIILEKY